MTTILGLSRLLLCRFLRKQPTFCTILPFYFGCRLVIFQAQLHAFNPQTPHFSINSALRAMFLMALKALISFFIVYIYAYYLAFNCIFALRLAPKRTAFSTKTHCI